MVRGREKVGKGKSGEGRATAMHCGFGPAPRDLQATCRIVYFCALILGIFLLSLSSGEVLAETSTAQQKRIGALEKRVADFEREVANLRGQLEGMQFPSPPEFLTLCDKPIPLWRDDVRERFEREFYLILENKGLLTILAKRHSKFLSSLSPSFDTFQMPPDLIYLAIAESYLNPRVVSTAGAGGMWQFMKETGKREGLFINDVIDERYSVPLSTWSALGYLRKLHAEFGDWFLAMAAYNCGEGRMREAIANQKTREFFDLFLPEETERYLMRIAVFKEMISSPWKYGISFDRKHSYRPYSASNVIITVVRDLHTSLLAQAAELPYKSFRDHNLHMRRYILSKGTYHVFLPMEKRDAFLRNIRTVPGVSIEKEN